MRMFVVAVRDSAALAFGTPVFVAALGQALRSFGDEINRKPAEGDLAKHPDDFELWHVADYDTETASFSPAEGGQRVLARGKDLVQA